MPNSETITDLPYSVSTHFMGCQSANDLLGWNLSGSVDVIVRWRKITRLEVVAFREGSERWR